MDNTHIYAIVAAGLVLCLLLRRGWPSVASHLAPFYFRVYKFLAYHYVLRRHALIGPWTAITVLAELIYLAVNVVCLALGAADWSQIGQRAGTLSVIHLGLLSSGLHLSFLASLLGLSLGTVRAIHQSAGVMTLGLVGCHIVVCAAADKPGFQREALRPFGITVREHPVDASPMLICSRPLRHCSCSQSSRDVSSRSCPTKSSFESISWSPLCVLIQPGGMSRPRGPFLTSSSISVAGCWVRHSSGRLQRCSSETVARIVEAHMSPSRRPVAWSSSRCIWRSHSRLSLVSTSIYGSLP